MTIALTTHETVTLFATLLAALLGVLLVDGIRRAFRRRIEAIRRAMGHQASELAVELVIATKFKTALELVRIDHPDAAIAVLRALVASHPRHDYARDARHLIRRLHEIRERTHSPDDVEIDLGALTEGHLVNSSRDDGADAGDVARESP